MKEVDLSFNTSRIGPVLFLSAICVHWLFGTHAMIRLVGLGCIVCGVLWIITRKISVGIEGRPPIHHLRGWAAAIAGLALFLVGIAMLFYAPMVACLLNWSLACYPMNSPATKRYALSRNGICFAA